VADRARGDKAEKFTTSLEPLPTLPTQLWSEPAQCVLHAFDVLVPANLRVGYVTAESEPVPEALQRLGIRVEMLNAAALAFQESIPLQCHRDRGARVRTSAGIVGSESAAAGLCVEGWNTRRAIPAGVFAWDKFPMHHIRP